MFFLLQKKANSNKKVSKPNNSLVASDYIKNLYNRHHNHKISNLFFNFVSNNTKLIKKYTLMSDRYFCSYYGKIILFLLALFIQLSFLNNNVSASLQYNNEAPPVERLAVSLFNGKFHFLFISYFFI